MQRNIRQQGRHYAPLRCSLLCCHEDVLVHAPCFEPAAYCVPHSWVRVQLVQKCLVIDRVKTSFDVRIQNIPALLADFIKDSSNGIVASSAGPEAIAVGLKMSLP